MKLVLIKSHRLIILLTLLTNSIIFGQLPTKSGFEDCSGKVIWLTKEWKKYAEVNYYSFKREYVLRNSPKNIAYFHDDTNTLKKFKEDFKFENLVSYTGFIDTVQTRINIYLSSKRYFIDESKFDDSMVMRDPKDFTSFPLELERAIGHEFYGGVEGDSIVDINFIDSIKVFSKCKNILFTDSILSKLCNPNITGQYNSYKPLEIYYSPTYERIYIYVMGMIELPNGDVSDTDGTLPDVYGGGGSYISKIIIDPKDNKDIQNITMPGIYLWSYGWPRCADFWAF